jgi:hypothetical protein
MTADQLPARLGISASAVSVNDLVAALGGLLAFIGYFVAFVTVSFGSGSFGLSGSASLASSGGFFGALVPIFAAVSAIAIVIPAARRFGLVFLVLASLVLGIGLGSRAVLGDPYGYGVGWWLVLIGGLLLTYGWIMRLRSSVSGDTTTGSRS